MTKAWMAVGLAGLLWLPMAARAAAPGEDPDVYYAPLDEAEGVSASAAVSQGEASHLSRAHLRAFAWGQPRLDLADVELYVDGALLGRSPLALEGLLVSAQGVSLAARADGYEEALRQHLALPTDGSVAIALLPENAAWPVTTPGWAVGLGMVLAGVLSYRTDSPSTGLALAGGGLVSAGLTQLWARYVTLPRLRAKVEAFNAGPQAEPVP